MYPRLITLPAFDLLGRSIGPMTLHTYGVLLALAFVAGLWVAGRQAKANGLDSARVTDMAVYVLIAGLVGAKLLLVVVEWGYYARNPGELLSIFQSGGVFYGGLLAAFPVAWWYARKHALPPWRTADALAPAVVLGQAVGRLGCFSAGCCYGTSADVPWAVTFHDPYAARTVGTPLDVPLHPTQLYEAGATLLIFLVLMRMARRKRFDGQVILAYVALYAVARFVIEFFRGDAVRGTVVGWLSTSQFIGLLTVVAVVLVLPYLARKNRVADSSPPAAPA
ncbi:MAG TPA: prolipoprotein diacylglyceryl transferase [Vicinamibacteria bacterium]|nr:prolipoprotein diacylglyceryl transferase [Vicinamibacteria bacterium]